MYNFKAIEKKWQNSWEKNKTFKAVPKGKKFYALDQFPYPSSLGLHMGHARVYVISDVNARFKKMQGFNVLHPVGYDSFGLPAENAAIQENTHPKVYTEKSIKNLIKQQKKLGLSYDWDRLIMSHTPDYYKWDQWLFLEFLKKGLAYRKKAVVNWCEKCNTVLANEQVIQGNCWRHPSTLVKEKELEQWFFRTTKYQDELLKDLEKLEWPEQIKEMQRNWIGKSQGIIINFPIEKSKDKIQVFTTRPDTLYGVTFIVYSPEHPKVQELIKGTKKEAEIKNFIKKAKKEDKIQRTQDKKGMFIEKYALHPLTKEKIPIFIGNFVLHEYGTGVIMGVPAHDQRDFEFAKTHNLPIKTVIHGKKNVQGRAYEGPGKLIHSGQFNNLKNQDAIKKISSYLVKNKLGN